MSVISNSTTISITDTVSNGASRASGSSTNQSPISSNNYIESNDIDIDLDQDHDQEEDKIEGFMLSQFYGDLNTNNDNNIENNIDPLDQHHQHNTVNIDSADFDVDTFVRNKLRSEKLDQLIQFSNELKSKTKTLDNDMQMLVYENYNKFISATDTIRTMKSQVELMENEMQSLLKNIEEISDNCTKIETTFAPNRQKIEKLVGIRKILKRLQFLFELPKRLRQAIDLGAYRQTVNYYKLSNKIFDQHRSSIVAFEKIQTESSKIIAEFKLRLMSEITSTQETCGNVCDTSSQSSSNFMARRFEFVQLLLELNEPPELLQHNLLSTQKHIFQNLFDSNFIKRNFNLIEVLSKEFIQQFVRFSTYFLNKFSGLKSEEEENSVKKSEYERKPYYLALISFSRDVFDDYLDKVRSFYEEGLVNERVGQDAGEGDEPPNLHQLNSSLTCFQNGLVEVDIILPDLNLLDSAYDIVRNSIETFISKRFHNLSKNISQQIKNTVIQIRLKNEVVLTIDDLKRRILRSYSTLLTEIGSSVMKQSPKLVGVIVVMGKHSQQYQQTNDFLRFLASKSVEIFCDKLNCYGEDEKIGGLGSQSDDSYSFIYDSKRYERLCDSFSLMSVDSVLNDYCTCLFINRQIFPSFSQCFTHVFNNLQLEHKLNEVFHSSIKYSHLCLQIYVESKGTDLADVLIKDQKYSQAEDDVKVNKNGENVSEVEKELSQIIESTAEQINTDFVSLINFFIPQSQNFDSQNYSPRTFLELNGSRQYRSNSTNISSYSDLNFSANESTSARLSGADGKHSFSRRRLSNQEFSSDSFLNPFKFQTESIQRRDILSLFRKKRIEIFDFKSLDFENFNNNENWFSGKENEKKFHKFSINCLINWIWFTIAKICLKVLVEHLREVSLLSDDLLGKNKIQSGLQILITLIMTRIQETASQQFEPQSPHYHNAFYHSSTNSQKIDAKQHEILQALIDEVIISAMERSPSYQTSPRTPISMHIKTDYTDS